MHSNRIAVTTDSFVIKPIFFSGGTIGKLSVSGTVNDLAVSGANPIYLTCGFVIEEGFPVKDLQTIVADMAQEAKHAGVSIIAGDTKVVEQGNCDGVFINTTCIGIVEKEKVVPSFQKGDAVILSGTIGDHVLAVLAAREKLGMEIPLNSDCASLNKMLSEVVKTVEEIRIMRDPTRGGLATTLVEMAEDFSLQMIIEESLIPVKAQVAGACDLLGFDPLYMANEGKAILIVPDYSKEEVLRILRRFPEGRDAVCIGVVTEINCNNGRLLLEPPSVRKEC